MRYAFPLEVDRTTFKGADYESWRQQETCPGPSIRGIVKSKLDKCMIHVDTFSSVPFYIGPEKYTGLPTPLIYSKPEYTYVENGCWYSLSGKMSELNCYCGSKRDGCAVLKEANDIICIEKQTDSINAVFFGTQTLAETKAAKSCVVRYMLSVSYQENVYFTHSLKVTFGADRSNVCHSKHEGTSCIMQNEPLCPFGASQSSSAVRIEVLCCCGPKHGTNPTFYHFCNLKQVNLTRIEVTLRKIPRCGVFPHLYQHFFLNSIYKGQCVVHHDFEFDSSVKLIHGLNMEFSNNMSPVEIYGSEKDVQLIDVLINRNATKCLGEHREREIMAASERKAWTIVIFKCTARLESAPCDTTMMRTLNRRKLSDDYGTFCYVGKSTSSFINLSSLFTRWCLERITGIGRGMLIERGFLTVGSFATMKDLPKRFQCIRADGDTYAINLGKSKNHYKCYRRFDKQMGVPETICCCKNAERSVPCNDAVMSAHVEWNALQRLSAIRELPPLCKRQFMSKYEDNEICNESLLERFAVCFYVANLRSQTLDGGCVFPGKPTTRHRLASVCKTKHSLNILKSNKTVDVFSEEQHTRLYCCHSHYNCFTVIRQMQSYERHFLDSTRWNETVVEAVGQGLSGFEVDRTVKEDTTNTSYA
uniref:Ras-GAP domain-containing protein n=1 Tax=Parascaris univalens TaxID=6257 RepID=A0A915A1J4_PARUN